MAKSRRGRSGSIPVGATAPSHGGLGRTVSLADLQPRAKPESDLESFVARDPLVNLKSRTPWRPGASLRRVELFADIVGDALSQSPRSRWGAPDPSGTARRGDPLAAAVGQTRSGRLGVTP